MAKLYTIQTGQTTWQAQERMESVAGAPLAPPGADEVSAAALQLQKEGIVAVYAGDGESQQQTAELLGKALGAKVRIEGGLRELDYGLWQGLIVAEIRRRQPKLYRQWLEAPACVRPPGGETLEEAQRRLQGALRGILRKHRNETVLVVLPPVAMGLVRCLLARQPLETLWQRVEPKLTWDCYDLKEKPLNLEIGNG